MHERYRDFIGLYVYISNNIEPKAFVKFGNGEKNNYHIERGWENWIRIPNLIKFSLAFLSYQKKSIRTESLRREEDSGESTPFSGQNTVFCLKQWITPLELKIPNNKHGNSSNNWQQQR
jgi:hypothetical protein